MKIGEDHWSDEDDARRWSPARIKKLRKYMGLTQPQFAAIFHINLNTVLRWEKGYHIPYPTTSRQLDKVLAREIAKSKREEAAGGGEDFDDGLDDGSDDYFDDAFDDGLDDGSDDYFDDAFDGGFDD